MDKEIPHKSEHDEGNTGSPATKLGAEIPLTKEQDKLASAILRILIFEAKLEEQKFILDRLNERLAKFTSQVALYKQELEDLQNGQMTMEVDQKEQTK